MRGRWQAPALRAATFAVLPLALASAIAPGAVGESIAWLVVALVIAVPLLRVAWLVVRFASERDWRFTTAGIGVLGIICLGVALAMVGVGG